MHRRQFIATGGLAVSVGLAGCSWPGSDSENSGQTVAPELQGSPTPPDAVTDIIQLHPLSRLWLTGSTLLAGGSDDSRQYVTAFDAGTVTRISKSVFDDRTIVGNAADAVFVEDDTGTAVVTVTDNSVKWKCDFTGTTFDAERDTVVLVEQNDNFADEQTLTGLDTEEWKTRWQVTPQGELASWGPEHLITTRQPDSENKTIVCRSTQTGEVLWSMAAPESFDEVERSLSFGGTVLLVSGSSMTGFDLQDGTEQFSDSFDPPFGRGSTQPPLESRWIVTDGRRAYVGADNIGGQIKSDSRLVAIDATDGITWTFNHDESAVRPFAVGESLVVELLREDGVGTVGLDPADGTVLYREPGTTIASGERGPYVLSGQTLTALTHDGTVRWQSSLTRESDELRDIGEKWSVELTQELLFVSSQSGITVFRTDDGSKTLDASGFGSVVDFVPVTGESWTDDRLFVAAGDKLYEVSL